jgi:hypothetical protein
MILQDGGGIGEIEGGKINAEGAETRSSQRKRRKDFTTEIAEMPQRERRLLR